MKMKSIIALIISLFMSVAAQAACECHPAQVGMTEQQMSVYAPLIAKAAKAHSLDEKLVWTHLMRLSKIERTGSVGPFKIMPAWHKDYLMGANPAIPAVNVDVGIEVFMDSWMHKGPTV